jgi:hypothetical protein
LAPGPPPGRGSYFAAIGKAIGMILTFISMGGFGLLAIAGMLSPR